jgi:hypothetical protein
MTAVYISPSLEAMHLGGLALMSGMTMFGGALEALLSRSMRRLRSLLPPELAGVVIVWWRSVDYRTLLAEGAQLPTHDLDGRGDHALGLLRADWHDHRVRHGLFHRPSIAGRPGTAHRSAAAATATC